MADSDNGVYLILIIVFIIIIGVVVLPKQKIEKEHITFDLQKNQVRDISSIDAQMERKYGREDNV